MNVFFRAVAVGIRNGIPLTLTTAAAILLASHRQRGCAWAAMNPICHMLDGDDHPYPDTFDPRDSLLGLAFLTSAMMAWSTLHQLAFRRARGPAALLAGLTTAAVAYGIDYYAVPPRFMPGIEQKIDQRSIVGVYIVLGVTLGLLPSADTAR